MTVFEIKRKIIGLFYEDRKKIISGGQLSLELGFSRASMWKYINSLRKDGYVIEAFPGCGYRLKSVPDKFYAYSVAAVLNTKIIGSGGIYCYDSVTSTNGIAYKMAEEFSNEWRLVIAEEQTAGKGRMNRKWVSPKGGLYLSFVLYPDIEIDKIPSITLTIGVSVAETISMVFGLKTKIKWPNDVFVNDKKVSGILTEIKAQPDRVDFLIIGIGINVNTPYEKLPSGSASLRIANRLDFLKVLLKKIEDNYLCLKTEGFRSLREKCKSMSMILGKRVQIVSHNRIMSGVAKDIDETGALMLETGGGKLTKIFSGDVSVRKI